MESLERFVVLATSTDITRAAASVPSSHADWTAERSATLGLAVSSMLKGYTTTAASVISATLRSITRFTIQVGCVCGVEGVCVVGARVGAWGCGVCVVCSWACV